jgi:hypothetical protein
MGFAIAGAALVGSAMASNAAGNAASMQSDAANRASAVSQAQYAQQREDAAPWRQAGTTALTGLQDSKFQDTFDMNKFQQDPGYQFRMDEGNKAINAAASARGMSNSGATMKALTRYGQDYSSGEYAKAYDRFNNDRTTQFNRLSSLAGIGQTANSQLAQAGMNNANQIGSNIMGAGNAAAAGAIGQSNAISGGINQGSNSFMQYQMMNRLAPPQNKNYASSGSSSSGGGGSNYSLGNGDYSVAKF